MKFGGEDSRNENKPWVKNVLYSIGAIIILLLILIIGGMYTYFTKMTNLDGKLICWNEDVRIATECIHKMGVIENYSANLKYGFENPDKFEHVSDVCIQNKKCLEVSDCWNRIRDFIDYEYFCDIAETVAEKLNKCFKTLENEYKNKNATCLDSLIKESKNENNTFCSEYNSNKECIHGKVKEMCGSDLYEDFENFEHKMLYRSCR